MPVASVATPLACLKGTRTVQVYDLSKTLVYVLLQRTVRALIVVLDLPVPVPAPVPVVGPVVGNERGSRVGLLKCPPPLELVRMSTSLTRVSDTHSQLTCPSKVPISLILPNG